MARNNLLKKLLTRFLWKNFLAALATVLFVSLLATALVVRYMERNLAADLERSATDRLVLYSGGLRSALNKYRYLPHILATHPDIVRLVTKGDNKDQINRYLEDINDASGSMALFVLDRGGTAIATSNWNNQESFEGHTYHYRPYYLDAISQGRGGYYGVGATTGNPGYFFTEQIWGENEPVGVAVTKVDLSILQEEWRVSGEIVFITDAHGVIFLSSRKDWLYRTTRPLGEVASAAMIEQRQYGNALPGHIDIGIQEKSGIHLLRLGGHSWIHSTQSLPEFGWTIWYLNPVTALKHQVDQLWLMGIGASCMLALLLLVTRLAFAWLTARRSAREAEKIRMVNTRLAEEVRIRKLTEKELLSAQADLLHTGRLAALGQVAASVAHELSQPVTSMQMFAASCRRFARNGDCQKVEETVEHLLLLVQRLKTLIGQLKHFSRRTPERSSQVMLAQAIRNVLTILEYKRVEASCEPDVHCPNEVSLTADAIQVEQILINLIHNALDAVSELPEGRERRVAVCVEVSEDATVISVTDNGPGIEPDLRESLFTPFVTSKKSGEGIGLGLAIVDNIVHGMRGSITAYTPDGGGASFIVHIPRK